ncbi:hypothetical protein QTN25_004564 [Entamoeba marina]
MKIIIRIHEAKFAKEKSVLKLRNQINNTRYFLIQCGCQVFQTKAVKGYQPDYTQTFELKKNTIPKSYHNNRCICKTNRTLILPTANLVVDEPVTKWYDINDKGEVQISLALKY